MERCGLIEVGSPPRRYFNLESVRKLSTPEQAAGNHGTAASGAYPVAVKYLLCAVGEALPFTALGKTQTGHVFDKGETCAL